MPLSEALGELHSMKYPSIKYFVLATIISFFSVAMNYWEVAIFSLVAIVPYYVYWAINHDLKKHRLEAFLNYCLILFTMIATFSVIYEMEGIICSGETIKDTYHSVYFSIVTWTTLGYGDCLPSENIKHIAAIEALFGYLMMAIFIALLLTLFSNKQTEFGT